MHMNHVFRSTLALAALIAASGAARAATPVAYWNGDFNDLTKGGYTLVLNGHTQSEDSSTVTLATSSDQKGLDINGPSAGLNNVTVLVKYSGFAYSTTYGKMLFAVSADANHAYDRVGIRVTVGNALAGCGNDNTNGSTTFSNYGAASGTPASEGYWAFTYSASAGTTLYQSSTANGFSNAAWTSDGLHYSSDRIYGVTVGGMRANNSQWRTADGLVVSAIAVFEGVLTVDEINAFDWPTVTKKTIAVTEDTSVSALNTDLASVTDVSLTVSPGVMITLDTTFTVSTVSLSSTGNVTLKADKMPSAAELAKLDVSGVEGALIRSWLNPGVVGFNFNSSGGRLGAGNADGAANTSSALAEGGTWTANASAASGSSTAMFVDGLTPLTWVSANVYADENLATGAGTFMQGYLDDGNGGAQVTVSRLPYETYDLILYCYTDTASRKFSPATVNGKTYTWDSTTESAVEGDATWGATQTSTTPILGTNTLRINGLSGKLTINGGENANSARGGIAAIQIMPAGVSSGATEYIIDATAGYTADSEEVARIRTAYGNVRIKGSGENGATVDFGSSLTPISSHVVFDGGTHTVKRTGGLTSSNNQWISDSGVLGANASAPIIETANGATVNFYQHDLSGWVGSAAVQVPVSDIRVGAGTVMNIYPNGDGTTYYAGRYTIEPGARLVSYYSNGSGGVSDFRLQGGAVEGYEQIYVPAAEAGTTAHAVFAKGDGAQDLRLHTDETVGLGFFVGENATLDFGLGIASAGAAPIGKWGAGTVNFNGDLSGYQGTLTINAGTVAVTTATTLGSVVNNATLTLAYGEATMPTISSYSGSGTVQVDVSSLVVDGAIPTGSYTLLAGLSLDTSKVELIGLPDESGFSVRVTENGVVLTDATDFYPEWKGASGTWSDSQFDGRTGSTDGRAVVFAESSGNEAVTVTVEGEKSVASLSFTADDTAYTLAGDAVTVAEGGRVSLNGAAPVTIANNLELPDGSLTGAGTLVLDPGAGNAYTMSTANTDFTGEAVIQSGTVSMANFRAFGQTGRASSIRVKRGATLSVACNNSNSTVEGEHNKLILEDGATYTSSSSVADTKLFPISRLTLEGNATIVADVANIGVTKHYNDPTTLAFGEYTLTKTGNNTLYLAGATMTGTGTLDIEEGTLNLNSSYYTGSDKENVFADGTVKIGKDAVLNLDHYVRYTTLTAKNFILNGTVTKTAREDATGANITVTGAVTGNGTTPMLTLGAEAVLKPTGTGYLTITDSLTLPSASNQSWMIIDLSDLDLIGMSVIPLFKVGSAEMLPAANDLYFLLTAGVQPGDPPAGWTLTTTRDGLGYRLVKPGFTIHVR